MTEQELREKIVKIALNTSWTDMFGDHYSIGESAANAIADALIAAGIGDVKDLQAQVNVLEITNIALQAGYDDAEKDRLYWVDKYKEAEHRAEKAEQLKNQYCRALLNLARRYVVKTNMTLPHGNEPHSRSTDIEMLALYIMANEREQAEKELAEENDGKKEV